VEGGDVRLAGTVCEAGLEVGVEGDPSGRRVNVTPEDSRAGKDWIAWHQAYDDDTPLRHRLLLVEWRIRETLLERPGGPIRVISACAGDGRDIIGALVDHPRAADVHGRLVELDYELATRAGAAAPSGIEVVCADAGWTDPYLGAVPADLVLLCGVFGNITDADVRETVLALPTLCASGASVVWTRHRRPPDLTVDIRHWFAVAGFEQVAFDAPAAFEWTVGVHRLVADPKPIVPGRRLFRFVTADRGPAWARTSTPKSATSAEPNG
jgi:hypothetical protein